MRYFKNSSIILEMTNEQEERMYNLFGTEDITTEQENELSQLVDQMVLELDQEIAAIDI